MNYISPASAFDVPRQFEAVAARHERGTRRAAVVVTLLFWASNYAVSIARDLYSPAGPSVRTAAMRVGLALVGCALCFVVHLVIQRLGKRPFHQKALAVALLIPFVADGYAWINHLGLGLVIAEPAGAPPASTSLVIFTVVYWVWFFMAWAAFYLALLYSDEARAQERRAAAVQALAHSAQLRALRYQVNPHFLFNALNAISALILDRRAEQADAMVTRLSDYFRWNLSLDPLDDVRLADEIALQALYLEIEQVRFPDLTIATRLPDALRGALVPSLILQPLVENAIKYAVAGSDIPARIMVSARTDDDWLVLEVIDDGRGDPASVKHGTGIGLSNVRARLSQRFGDVQSFEAGPVLPHGFKVTLRMPLRFAP